MKKIILFTLLNFLGISSFGQNTPQFVKQLGQVFSIVEMNGYIYFSADNALWKSDGTEAGTVVLKQFQNIVGQYTVLTKGNGNLYFFANDGTNGYELWKSDGTVSGTSMLKDINPTGHGFPTSNVQLMLWVDNTLFFSANDGINGIELWKSDGTELGTFMIKDLNPGMNGSIPQYAGYLNGVLYFDASDGVVSRELFKSDGTETGTVLVKDIGESATTGINPGLPCSFTVYNNEMYFIARPFNGQFYLMKTDGTSNGTVVVTNQLFSSYFSPISIYNGQMFFPAQTSWGNLELAKSDGTFGGTSILAEINQSGESNPSWFSEHDGKLYFSANDGINGTELWQTNGINTSIVKNINPATTSSSDPTTLLSMGDKFYFAADDGQNGRELWSSDGTTTGTNIVNDLRPGSSGSYPSNLIVMNNTLYFTATDGSQIGLWKLDGATNNVNTKQVNKVKVYPIPVSQELSIELNENTSIEIMDITGKVILKAEGNDHYQVDISSFKNGVYFIRTQEGEVVKFIKD